jgi:DNA-directed RNA polymerase sigma subunit (sigma70/sigma32)
LDYIIPGSDTEMTLGDTLTAPAPDEQDPDADELAMRMAALDPLEQRLIEGRWGLRADPATLRALAAQEAISLAEVKVNLAKAMSKLRRESPPPAPTLAPWRPEQCCQLSLSLSTLNQ